MSSNTSTSTNGTTGATTSTSDSSSNTLKSIIYENEGYPKLQVLDQLLIPEQKVYVSITDVEAAWAAIKTMQVRGAPLIAIVAVLGLAVDVVSEKTSQELSSCTTEDGGEDDQKMLLVIQKKVDYLRTSRPTAVNLFNAMDELMEACTTKAVAATAAATTTTSKPPTSIKDMLVETIVSYGEHMLRADVRTNQAIGAHGADAILRDQQRREIRVNNNDNSNNNQEDQSSGVHVLTICNTGSLATAGYGTALGVVRALMQRHQLASITALETRPYNQGSRLTAFEMVEENMPNATLITDSMVAAYMHRWGKNQTVDAVVVGADRICANGDTANKIGTLQLAILANHYNVPFYVAAPFTTLDMNLNNGSCIEIEERPPSELIQSSRAPANIQVWNPSFDVTPAALITGGIITEHGVITKSSDDTEFNISQFIQDHQGKQVDEESTKRIRLD
jgi:S-methyl-5-thioribose-1-phosphate isomerase